MSKMNREILIPYLQDVCALQLAKKKCQDQREELRADCERIRCNANDLKKPTLQPENKCAGYSGLTSVVLVILVCLPLFFSLDKDASSLLGVGIKVRMDGTALLFTISLILVVALYEIALFAKNQRNNDAKKHNEIMLNQWKWELSQQKLAAMKKCESINLRIVNLEQEVRTIDNLLNNLYSANLIPSRYRDLYAAVYLYDWFSTGMSDDMDMALNTYILEQIKSRLDTIIQNQAVQIINQRAILANQARSMNMIERNAQEMRNKVSRMNESLEKQNMYLKMIDGNVAATRYFAEETYRKWN